jgi:hypothetical protein
MQVKDIAPILPLAEVYELDPQARYIVRVPQAYCDQNAIQTAVQTLKEFGLTRVLIVAGEQVQFYEIKD